MSSDDHKLLPKNFGRAPVLFPQPHNGTALTAVSEVWRGEGIRVKRTDEN